jgi:hypothetical protein
MFGFLTRRYDLSTEIQTRGPGPRKQYEDVLVPAGPEHDWSKKEPRLIRTRMIRAVTHAGHAAMSIIATLLVALCLFAAGEGPVTTLWVCTFVPPVFGFVIETLDALLLSRFTTLRPFSAFDVLDYSWPSVIVLPAALHLSGIVSLGWYAPLIGVAVAVLGWWIVLPWESANDG